MRTTIDIEDDLLAASKELARHEGTTAGVVISRLLRQALTGQVAPARRARPQRSVAGFQPFEGRPGVVTTLDEVNALRDAEGI